MKTLLSAEEVREGVARVAGDISRDYVGRSLTIVGVLTGSIVLLADLIRLLDLPLRVGLVQAHSYRGPSTVRGALSVNADLMPEIADRHVLLVDDIFDTGHTLHELVSQLDELQPASIRSAVLLEKQERREVSLRPDYVAFEIPNKFVVGYGLDYNDQFRNLPYVAALDDDEVAGKGE